MTKYSRLLTLGKDGLNVEMLNAWVKMLTTSWFCIMLGPVWSINSINMTG